MGTIVVTGASGNLGKAVVKTLALEAQHVLAVVSPRSADAFLGRHGVETAVADAFNEKQAAAVVREAAKKHGEVTGLVATVGGFAAGSLEETGLAELEQMIRLNFYSAYAFARPALSLMKRQAGGGRLVFIGSRGALEPKQSAGKAAYAFSKSLLLPLAENINSLPGPPVKAFVLVPGTIDTPQNRAGMPGADFSKWVSPGALAGVVRDMLSGDMDAAGHTVVKMYGN